MELSLIEYIALAGFPMPNSLGVETTDFGLMPDKKQSPLLFLNHKIATMLLPMVSLCFRMPQELTEAGA